MRKIFVASLLTLFISSNAALVHAADNKSFFQNLIPDNASISAVKESGRKTLDAGEEVLGTIVEDSKGFGSFLLKKAGDVFEDTKNTVKSITE